MQINLKKISILILLSLLPFIRFIQTNINLIDTSTFKSLILINLPIFISIFTFSYLISVINKKLTFFDNSTFLLLAYNISFYFNEIKFFLLKYTSFASYFSLIVIFLFYLIILKIFKKKLFINFIFFYLFLRYLSIVYIITTSIIIHDKSNNNIEKKDLIFQNEKIIQNKFKQPNIYVVILDGMTSLEYAKKILNVNYDDHSKFLKNNNFETFKSRSNYNTTYLTLASILQMDYVVKQNSPRYFDRNNFWPYLLSKINKKPNLIKVLENNNYNFKWFGNMTASCKNYAYDNKFCPNNELNSTYYIFNSFFYNTPLITILRKLFPELMLSYYGDKIDSIGNFINANYIYTNSFVLIHHLSPHPPYIYNKDCSLIKNLNSSVISKNMKGYRDAYLCSLRKIEEFINFINKNDPSALVMITADHGWNINTKIKKSNLISLMEEKTKIYNAMKIDKICKKNIPKLLDSINSMRLLLGCAINRRPIFKKTEILYGFQEEDGKKFGKVYKLSNLSK